jgi:hypothetical protein
LHRVPHLFRSIVVGIFFGGFGAGLLVCGIGCAQQHSTSPLLVTTFFSFLLSKVCRTTAPPVLKPENNTASAAWSKQQPLEMQPQTLAREASFGQPSRRSHALKFFLMSCFF